MNKTTDGLSSKPKRMIKIMSDNYYAITITALAIIQFAIILAILYYLCFKRRKNTDTSVSTPLIETKTTLQSKTYSGSGFDVRRAASDDALLKNMNRDWKRIDIAKHDMKCGLVHDHSTGDEGSKNDVRLECFKDDAEPVTCDMDLDVSRTSGSTGREKQIHHNTGYEASVSTNGNRSSKTEAKSKAAQAIFSNDTIDNYLSETGMACYTNEDLCNLSKSTSSTKNSNKKVKNAFSIFRKKSAVSSDFGK